MNGAYEVIVVGGGHAGVEAAWAAAGALGFVDAQADPALRVRAPVCMVTLDPSKVGVMPCNPAIGGLAKGQIVREIDALGGLMGRAADATGIMFKELNASKGPAVRGPRAQCDKHAYAREVQRLIASQPGIEVLGAAVQDVLTDGDCVRGVRVRTPDGSVYDLTAGAVVVTTGTFMRGLMHTGPSQVPGGRAGESPASALSGSLRGLGFELGRLKTGTPPRLRRSTIDWDSLEAQHGDADPKPFSDLSAVSSFPQMAQTPCAITRTSASAHALIRANLHRAPMFSGQIESTGPRYCPSIEDKVVRFADRTEHHVFLEPESYEDETVYCNGIATSLPSDVQEALVRSMPGCDRAEIVLAGYAVEYDTVLPHQIDAGCMTKSVGGLFFAGQLNGTSGYEEAAGQGLLAGVNAARFVAGESSVRLGRDEAYIGVMLDDLVTKTPREPYRMFTSRAEHRLTLRADNSADRLTPLGKDLGLVSVERWRRFESRASSLAALRGRVSSVLVGSDRLSDLIKRPGFGAADLAAQAGGSWSAGVLLTVLAERQYAGYIARQVSDVKRRASMEGRRIPAWFDVSTAPGLRAEAREAITKFRPTTFGQAGRLAGVTPADLSLLLALSVRGPSVGA